MLQRQSAFEPAARSGLKLFPIGLKMEVDCPQHPYNHECHFLTQATRNQIQPINL